MKINKKVSLIVFALMFITIAIAVAPVIRVDAPTNLVSFQRQNTNLTFTVGINGSSLQTCLFEYNGANNTIDCSQGNFTNQPHLLSQPENFGASADAFGVRILVGSQNIFVDQISKLASDDSTRGQIRDVNEVNLSVCGFSGDDCVFASPVELTANTLYNIVADGNGSSVTRFRNNSGSLGLYPIVTDWFDYNATFAVGAIDVFDLWTLENISVSNIDPNENITISFDINTTSIDNRTVVIFSNNTDDETSVQVVTWNYEIFEISRSFNASVFDTDTQGFEANVSFNSTQFTSVSSQFFYNGTSFSSTQVGSSDNIRLSSSIQIPIVNANETKNLFWSYTLTNSSETVNVNTTVSTQTVVPTNFSICGSGNAVVPFLNISYFNETVAQEATTAFISASSFTFWLGDASVNKTTTFSTVSESANHTFCGTPAGRTINVIPTVNYDNAESEQREFSTVPLALTNTTTEQVLFLLPTNDGIFVTFQIINSGSQPISGALVKFTRSGSDVSQSITGASGTTSVFLNPNFVYTIEVSATGFNTFSTTQAFPTSEFSVTLGLSSVVVDDFNRGVTFDINPKSQVLINNTFYLFNYTIQSSFFSLDSFGFVITNSSGTVLATNTSSIATGGTLFNNLSTGDHDFITMEYFWQINGSFNNRTVSWAIRASDPGSIQGFFDRLKTYIDDGIFGIDNFGVALILFLVIFITGGILSFRFGLNSPMAIFSVVTVFVIFLDVLEILPNPTGLRFVPSVIMVLILMSMIIGGRGR